MATKQLILVVGAGPSGLFFAHQMVKRGHHVRIIDRKQGLSSESKALGIHARTLEILGQAGIVADFIEEGRYVKGIFYYGGNKHMCLDFTKLATPYPEILVLPQSNSEKILYKHLKSLGASVEWETELERLENGTCHLRKADNSREVIQPDWIIGADGGRSRVREGMGVEFIGKPTTHTMVLADVQGEIPIQDDYMHLFVGYSYPMAIFPFPPNIYRVAFLEKHSEVLNQEQYTLDFIKKSVEARSHLHLGKLHDLSWLSVFQIKTCYAEHFHKNNCFLIGDAAHVHSPVGGQGMNMSLQDGYNLSWKLDLVIKKASPPQLLNTFEPERQGVVLKILRTTEKMTNFLFSAPKWVRCTLLAIFHVLQRIPKVSYAITFETSQLALNYKDNIPTSSADKKWKGPKPGERAPYAHLKDGRSLFDLFRSQKHTVLLFENNPAILKLVQQFNPWVEVHVIEGREIENAYNSKPQSIYVIRPDGYIGYRKEIASVEDLEAYLSSFLRPCHT